MVVTIWLVDSPPVVNLDHLYLYPENFHCPPRVVPISLEGFVV